MSLLMMLAASGARTLVTKRFTASAAWIAPVAKLELAEGYGARGTSGTNTRVQQYYFESRNVTVHPDGSTSSFPLSTSQTFAGAARADYCDPLSAPDDAGNRSQICYHFVDNSIGGPYTTTGASATAFGRAFPGSTGNTDPLTTVFTNIIITPGASYNIVVPSGGSITITYYG